MPRSTLAEEIAKKILRDFKPAEALPSERALAEKYSCNRLTLRRALKRLSEEKLLTSVPRNGHFITEKIPKKTTPLSPGEFGNKIRILALISNPASHSNSNTIAGFIHYSMALGVELIIREITQDFSERSFQSCEDIHPETSVDAYIICGRVSFRLYELLAKSMRPCVMLGLFEEQDIEQNYELRCLQMLLSLEEPYANAAKRLIELGHKKIMLASIYTDKETSRIKSILQRQFRDAGIKNASIEEEYIYRHPVEISNKISSDSALEIASRINGHSAVISIWSGVFGYQMMKILSQKKYSDVSLITQGSENDWYQDIHQLDRIYFERQELGGACIREVLRQIRNGRLDYGIRYLPGSYIPGKSLLKNND